MQLDARPARRASSVRVLAVLAVSLALLWVTAGPATAHATLTSTNPAAGQAVPESPDSIVLRFDDPVTSGPDTVRLYDQAGRLVRTGPAPSGTARVVRVPLSTLLRDGRYLVLWHVVSDDGHPIEGEFTFRVGGGAGPVRPLTQVGEEVRSNDETARVVYTVARLLAFAALMVLIGSAVFLVLVWPAGRDRRRARRVVGAAAAATVLTTLLELLAYGPYVNGRAVTDAFALLDDVVGRRYGVIAIVRLCIVAAAVIVVFGLRRSRRNVTGAALVLGTAVICLALAATAGLAGHAVTGDVTWLAVPFDALHVAMAGTWLGGLVMLGLVVLPAEPIDALAPVLGRFSRVAAVAVTVIVLTGLFASWRQVRSLDNVLDTDYGLLLLAKVVVVALALLVARFSNDIARFITDVVGGRLVDTAGGDADKQDVDLEVDRRALRRGVAVETLLLVAVLAITSVLVDTAPARTADLAKEQPVVSFTLRAPTLQLQIVIAPGRVGPNDIHASTYDATGTIRDATAVDLTLVYPSRGEGQLVVPLRRLGPGHFIAPQFVIPVAGRWRADARVQAIGSPDVMLSGFFILR